jgi:hypothetical protein
MTMDSADELIAERRLHAAVEDGRLTADDLREAITLLRDSRSDFTDPGLRGAYGRRRKRVLDRLLTVVED